ncbi:MAG TPA: T9SS type A sorting domain-containing protein [Puia sp.]|uniref:T9SS type A sorting domain-containing protein n=1 Tax=Puia sp. TaxID=2045100 RepID=UPI002C39B19E|nr:T9SS type A sorting domain-containing protein [Puia sp.]HVU97624.1 T9SS type A sorting domain-containing protein [Puia sp.]
MGRPDPFLLKNLCLSICIGMLIHSRSYGQCQNYQATKSYDTTLSNTGFAVYTLPFPQFDPDSGLLISVKLSANVTSSYGFNLTNLNPTPATYDLTVGQEDMYMVSGRPSVVRMTPKPIGTYTLGTGESESQALFPLITNNVTVDSITDATGPFMGKGNVSVRYMSFTYTSLLAYNSPAYTFSSSTISATKFSMSYLYCRTGIVLATDLTRFTATLAAPSTVQLDWSTVNETAARQYEIQRSEDGHSFTTTATMNANGDLSSANYTYNDVLPHGANGNVFYRLQMNDNGKFTWSPVKQVSVGSSGKNLRIYPNPATDHIDIATGTPNGDWQVDILSASGGLVQHAAFLQSNLLHLPFSNHLSAGPYFVRITDLRGQRVSISSFIVRDPG